MLYANEIEDGRIGTTIGGDAWDNGANWTTVCGRVFFDSWNDLETDLRHVGLALSGTGKVRTIVSGVRELDDLDAHMFHAASCSKLQRSRLFG